VVATLCQAYFHRKIGGVTGDCLGAANQLQEIAVVLGLLVWAGW
jgi:adenosylcobinamide-GDP ribazoletransferase